MQYVFAGWLATTFSLIIVTIFSAFLRRLLGGVPGRFRSFIVALAAYVTVPELIVPLARSAGFIEGTRVADPAAVAILLPLSACGVAVSALGLLVLLEVVVPTGSIPTPVTAARSTRQALRRSLRYLQLAAIAVTSGLWRFASLGPDSAKFQVALVRTLERAGATFVKLGQVLSTRTEIISPQLASALARLQKDVRPFPFRDVDRMLTEAWGQAPTAVLASIEETPLASASLGQVHRAQLQDGTDVVVKLRRPKAREQVLVDCDILERFAKRAEVRWSWARSMGVSELVRGLVNSLRGELDYRNEASNAHAVAAALKDFPQVRTPRIFMELSTSSVLVMTRMSGKPAVQAELDEAARQRVVSTLIDTTLQGILVTGVFHADLHPGNIYVLDDGNVALLDFGAIGVLGGQLRDLLITLLFALASDDETAAATALTLAFGVSADVDRRTMSRDLGRLMTLNLRGGALDNSLFDNLGRFLRSHAIAVPPDVAAAFRTLASLWGTVSALDPDASYTDLLNKVPSIAEQVATPTRLAAQTLADSLVMAQVARRLPARIEAVSDDLAEGRFTVRTRGFSEPQDRQWLASLVDDAASAGLSAIFIVGAVWLFTTEGGPRAAGSISVFAIIATICGVIGSALALRLIVRLFGRSWRAPHRSRSDRDAI